MAVGTAERTHDDADWCPDLHELAEVQSECQLV